MLLRAMIICCTIVVNAEPPLNSYSFTGGSNGYDYGNAVTNNAYLQSKNSYQNDGNFYGAGDGSRKLSDQVSGPSLIGIGNQDSIGADIGNNYNGYTASNQEYAGYSNAYENPDSDSYASSTRASSINTLLNGYSNPNNNAQSTLTAFSNSPIYKDSDFGQYATGNNNGNDKRTPAYSENYPADSINSDAQGYRGTSSSSSYSETDHIYPSYLQGGLTSEYSFGKQKDASFPYNPKGSNKYGGIIYSMPSETRFTRGNAGLASHNRDVPSYVLGSRPSNHFSKTYGSGIYSAGKSNKYNYKYLSRYAPNSGVSYLPRERDGYYAPYGKDSRKIIIIKDSRQPSYGTGRVYSDESGYASGYRSKSGSFINDYSVSPNFDAYSGGSSNYNERDNPTVSRRYRISGSPVLMKRATSV